MSEFEFYCMLNLLELMEQHKNKDLSEDYNNIIDKVCETIKEEIKKEG